jgi:predicted nucleotidyltransferase
MDNQIRTEKIKANIRSVFPRFRERLAGRKVVLFGSRADGNAKERSDFDIGIIGTAPVPASLFFEIEDALDSINTLYKIDFVDIESSAPSFKAQAMSKYEIMYE